MLDINKIGLDTKLSKSGFKGLHRRVWPERECGYESKRINVGQPQHMYVDQYLGRGGWSYVEQRLRDSSGVAEGGKVVGLVTDRDICMAAALKGRQLADITVEETVSKKVFSCKPDEDVHAALKTMQENRVRRLPVVAADKKIVGVLSMNDVVLKADEGKEKKLPELSYGDVVNTFKAICQHRLPAKQAQAAPGV